MIIASLSPATGPLLVTAALLAAAGVAKLSRPAPTGLAMAQLGLPGSDRVVRALGQVEVTAALAAALLGGVVAVPVVALYLGFTAVTVAQVRRARAGGEAADCGCFGAHSGPVDATHVVANVLAAAAAAWGVSSEGLLTALGDSTARAVLVLGLAIVGAVAVRAVLTDLAVVRALVRIGGDA